MLSVGNCTASYAKALLAGTKQVDLAEPDKPKRVAALMSEQMVRIEREMASLNRDFKALESFFGDDVLHLVIASGYLSRLIGNAEIHRYLESRHPESREVPGDHRGRVAGPVRGGWRWRNGAGKLPPFQQKICDDRGRRERRHAERDQIGPGRAHLRLGDRARSHCDRRAEEKEVPPAHRGLIPIALKRDLCWPIGGFRLS